MPLINYEINLILTWSENCVLTSKATRYAVPAQGGNPPVSRVNIQTNARFKITEQNYMYQLLLYQQKMIILFWNN